MPPNRGQSDWGTFRGADERRQRRSWGATGVLLAAALLSGAAAVGQSLALSGRRGDVFAARQFAPYDARLKAVEAQGMLEQGAANGAIDRRALRLAHQALERDPTATPAITVLGLKAEADGDVVKAEALFRYSTSITRRDLPARLWMIEDAVRHGNVVGALRHYDIALRTSKSAQSVLFPILATAIADPALSDSLADILAQRPLWGDSFLHTIGTQGPDYGAAARLFVKLRAKKYRFDQGIEDGLVSGLLASGKLEAAWQYYAARHPSVDRRRVRNGDFSQSPSTPSPFDWNVSGDDGVVTLGTGASGAELSFQMTSPNGGTVARQLQLLPPGRYRISGMSDRFGGSVPYWLLTCGEGRELGRVLLGGLNGNGGYAGEVLVPKDCPAQWLRLVVPASDETSGLTGSVKTVSLALRS